MKRLLLPLLCISALTVNADAAPLKKARLHRSPVKTELTKTPREKAGKSLRRAQADDAKWLASTQEISIFIDDEWLPVERFDITYNAQGAAETELDYDLEEGTISRLTYTYDENGFITRRLSEFSDDEGETFENSELLDRTYDSRIPSLIVANDQQLWVDGEWQKLGNNYKRIITRDDAGNITKMEIATLYEGEYDVSQYIEISYDADGKASTISEHVLDYDYANDSFYWKDGDTYSDIEWENTDGQIYQIDNLFRGDNRIKSATLTDSEGTEYSVSASYTQGSDSYIATIKTDDGEGFAMTAIQDFASTDAFGSYRYTTDVTYDEEGELYNEKMTETNTNDAWGNNLLYEVVYDIDGEEFIEERNVGTVEFDATYGYPTLYTLEVYDYETDEMGYYLRIAYSNYHDLAGVSATPAYDPAAPVEYYNLQGFKVANPESGIFICRQGNKVSKIIK